MKKIVVACVASLIATSALADTAEKERAYVYGSVGGSQLYSVRFGKVGDLGIKRDAFGYKLQAGYQFSPFLAVEGGYINFGKHGFGATNLGGTSYNGNTKVDGFNLNLVGSFPVADAFSIYAKLGGLWSQTRTSMERRNSRLLMITDGKVRGFSLFGGVGVRYNVDDNSSLRLDYDISTKIGKDQLEFGKFSPGMWSLGYQYSF